MANEITKVTDKNNVDHPLRDAAAQTALTGILNGQSIDSFGDVESALEDYFPRSEQAVLGAKNMLPIDIATVKALNADGTWTGNSYAKNGVTYNCTVEDGQVTNIAVSGNVSANTDLILYRTNLGGAFVGKNVTMSGCPSGGSGSSYYLNGYRLGSVDGSSGSVQETGSGVTFDFLNNDSGTRGWIGISIASGTNITTAVNFKPMIRLASDTDDTYAPYAKTNKELTEDVAIQESALSDLGNIVNRTRIFSSNATTDTANKAVITFSDNYGYGNYLVEVYARYGYRLFNVRLDQNSAIDEIKEIISLDFQANKTYTMTYTGQDLTISFNSTWNNYAIHITPLQNQQSAYRGLAVQFSQS